MKREIKFRLWDKEHKRMLSIETLALRFSPKGLLTSIYTYGPDFSNDPDIICGDEPDLDSVILEQFTGLDDINGKPIYEGDIVRWGLGHEKPVRVAVVIFDPDICFDSNVGIFDYGNFAYKETDKYLTVIGNIHENPELLEAEK